MLFGKIRATGRGANARLNSESDAVKADAVPAVSTLKAARLLFAILQGRASLYIRPDFSHHFSFSFSIRFLSRIAYGTFSCAYSPLAPEKILENLVIPQPIGLKKCRWVALV